MAAWRRGSRTRTRTPAGPFERPTTAWAALGVVDLFDGRTGARPDTLPARVHALVEASALTPDEVTALQHAADGTRPLDGLTPEQAAHTLARWRGPIPGLRLLPLAHHTPTTNGTER